MYTAVSGFFMMYYVIYDYYFFTFHWKKNMKKLLKKLQNDW